MVERHPTLTAAVLSGTAALCLAAVGWIEPLLSAPPLAAPASIPYWWYRSGPVVATVALLRLAGVAAGAYLELALLVSTVARSTRRRRLQQLTTLLLPRPARGLLAVAAGLCTVAHPVVAAAAVVAGPHAAIAAHHRPAAGPEARTPGASPPAATGAPGPTPSSGAPAPPPVLSPAGPLRPPAPSIVSGPAGAGRPRRSRRPRQPRPEWTVRAGQSFWSIAESVVCSQTVPRSGPAAAGGAGTTVPGRRPPDPVVVARYWAELVAANLDRLPVPGDPDILYVGDRLRLPPLH